MVISSEMLPGQSLSIRSIVGFSTANRFTEVFGHVSAEQTAICKAHPQASHQNKRAVLKKLRTARKAEHFELYERRRRIAKTLPINPKPANMSVDGSGTTCSGMNSGPPLYESTNP